jgi:hypothetical protein
MDGFEKNNEKAALTNINEGPAGPFLAKNPFRFQQM